MTSTYPLRVRGNTVRRYVIGEDPKYRISDLLVILGRPLWPAHERRWHFFSSHMIHISDWRTVHPSISWGLVYSGTWSYTDQSQPILRVIQASLRKSIPCYRTNEYYQSKRRFYRVIGISRDNMSPNTWFPTEIYLSVFPHIKFTSYHIKLSSPQQNIMWRRRLRREMCLLLSSNYINQLDMMNAKSHMMRTSY